MECEDYTDNGASAVDVRCRGFKRRLSGTRVALPYLPAVAARRPAGGHAAGAAAGPPSAAAAAAAALDTELPFMNEMDEITYWIYTKRAPCLMSYDETARRRAAARRQTQPTVTAAPAVSIHSSPPQNKKRKLSLLDDDSDSGKGHENIFFDSSQPPLQQQTGISSDKTSDVNFNIRKSSVREKNKKFQKKRNNPTVHKKNKVVCSTPKNETLRRSTRNSRKSLTESRGLNTSYELINVKLNGSNTKMSPPTCRQTISTQKKTTDNVDSSDQKTDQNINSRLGTEHVKTKTNVNGKFEDLSDVSGFTANYIRSTRIHSTKNGKKGKSNRSLLKESRQSLQKDPSKTVACINKSINTGLQNTALNYSTDSSQNCLNLVTTEKNGPVKISKSTSLLKFMDSKQTKNRNSQIRNLDVSADSSKIDLDVSRQSQLNGTRYPRRCRASAAARLDASDWSPNNKYTSKTCPVESPTARVTRASSGRVPRASVLVLSASSERVSSALTVNVAGPTRDTSETSRNKQNSTVKSKRRKKSMNKSEHSAGRDSLRNKSGFAACFSDSDDDDKPLKPQKFFC